MGWSGWGQHFLLNDLVKLLNEELYDSLIEFRLTKLGCLISIGTDSLETEWTDLHVDVNRRLDVEDARDDLTTRGKGVLRLLTKVCPPAPGSSEGWLKCGMQ